MDNGFSLSHICWSRINLSTSIASTTYMAYAMYLQCYPICVTGITFKEHEQWRHVRSTLPSLRTQTAARSCDTHSGHSCVTQRCYTIKYPCRQFQVLVPYFCKKAYYVFTPLSTYQFLNADTVPWNCLVTQYQLQRQRVLRWKDDYVRWTESLTRRLSLSWWWNSSLPPSPTKTEESIAVLTRDRQWILPSARRVQATPSHAMFLR
jgi:hypothetical protein